MNPETNRAGAAHAAPPAHFAHWPGGLAHHLTLPETHLYANVEVSARRYPRKPFVVFYDNVLDYGSFHRQCEAVAGWLRHVAGVRRGDRVLLDLQNSPQWIVGYYAILRTDAVVVPVNPMNRTEELRHYVRDAGARVALVAQDLLPEFEPLLAAAGAPRQADGSIEALEHVLVACYGDALVQPTSLRVPDFVAAPRQPLDHPRLTAWADAIAAAHDAGPCESGPDDLAVMPYTSGTTGHPKGCMHTHRSVMSTAVGGIQWFGRNQDSVSLSVLPFFHVTGMAGGMNGPIFAGATIVVLPRWDREAAVQCIERYRVNTWQAISTMVIDFLATPGIEQADLSSLQGIRGGGAAMPAAVAARLRELTGLDYVEGYGMSETLAATHINPPQRPKPQCLGIPVFDVDARLVDPATLAEVPAGETGEIVVHAPQVMQGYWRNEAATAEAFLTIDGRRFLRTGDLARIDEEGYFFMVDRLKRMINASGFKVWPAEVEALMFRHPAIQEACVIGARDARRGETVKALVVLRPAQADGVTPQAIIDWCHGQMAAYKVPRIVEIVASLPKSGTGKVMWRDLQEKQAARDAAAGG